jgi:hypothetical protein
MNKRPKNKPEGPVTKHQPKPVVRTKPPEDDRPVRSAYNPMGRRTNKHGDPI